MFLFEVKVAVIFVLLLRQPVFCVPGVITIRLSPLMTLPFTKHSLQSPFGPLTLFVFNFFFFWDVFHHSQTIWNRVWCDAIFRSFSLYVRLATEVLESETLMSRPKLRTVTVNDSN